MRSTLSSNGYRVSNQMQQTHSKELFYLAVWLTYILVSTLFSVIQLCTLNVPISEVQNVSLIRHLRYTVSAFQRSFSEYMRGSSWSRNVLFQWLGSGCPFATVQTRKGKIRSINQKWERGPVVDIAGSKASDHRNKISKKDQVSFCTAER